MNTNFGKTNTKPIGAKYSKIIDRKWAFYNCTIIPLSKLSLLLDVADDDMI